MPIFAVFLFLKNIENQSNKENYRKIRENRSNKENYMKNIENRSTKHLFIFYILF